MAASPHTLFYFGESVRWSWPWPSPNCLGAFAAAILPYTWAVAASKWRSRTVTVSVVACELGLYWVLCKTCSRGALCAVIVAAVVYLAYAFSNRNAGDDGRDVRGAVAAVAWRGGALGACLVTSGFFGRIAPGYLSSDIAVTNRATLWKGCLQMLKAKPWFGWGDGAVLSYMQWYQPPRASTDHGNMVSGILQFVVEHGLFPAMLVVIFLSWCLLAPVRIATPGGSSRIPPKIVEAAGASLAAFLITDALSRLHVYASLAWLPALGLCLCVFGSAGTPRESVMRRTTWAASIAAVLVGMTLVGAHWCERASGLRVRPRGESVVELKRERTAVDAPIVHVFPDPDVLGFYPGKALRELVAAEPSEFRFWIHTRHPDGAVVKGKYALWFGSSVEQWTSGAADRSAVIHPQVTIRDPREIDCEVVCLAEIDLSGQRSTWQAARGSGPNVLLWSSGVGSDIRPLWPEQGHRVLAQLAHE